METVRPQITGRSRRTDLTTVIDAVKAAEKEKRTSDKEIDAIRSKLRQIQNVTI